MVKSGGSRGGGREGSIDAITNSYSGATAEDDELVAGDSLSEEERRLFGSSESGLSLGLGSGVSFTAFALPLVQCTECFVSRD